MRQGIITVANAGVRLQRLYEVAKLTRRKVNVEGRTLYAYRIAS